MSHSVRIHLRLDIDAYDEAIRQFIPGYEEGLNRIAGEVAAIRPARVRFRERLFEAPLPACDAVAACLALHHIPAMQRKRNLYKHIFRALRPGGVFVTADVTMTADPEERERSYRIWTAHLVSRGIDEPRAREHFDEWSSEDTYFPVEDELAAMRETGFVAECTWQDPPNTLLVGRRH